jgi:hypothetical protein
MQLKFQKDIKAAIRQYLWVIDLASQEEQPKL